MIHMAVEHTSYSYRIQVTLDIMVNRLAHFLCIRQGLGLNPGPKSGYPV
jgi:hypothetical protein